MNFSFYLFLKKFFKTIWLQRQVTTEDFRNLEVLSLTSNVNNIENLLIILRDSSWFRFSTLIDLTCVDNFPNSPRFEINYFLLSCYYNQRLQIKVFLEENHLVPSVSSIYKSANWLEREIWDLFGVFFSNHPDLRRILTDYGFEGHPLRKDFPLSGYVEIRYDDSSKRVLIEPIKLLQRPRDFTFDSPWEKIN